MNPITKILVPTDFSANADAAFERAHYLAQRCGASVTVLHVYQLPMTYEGYNFAFDVIASIEKNARAALDQTKERWEKSVRGTEGGRPVPFDTRLEVGDPSTVIGEIARDGNYDLIVMSTHGRSGFAHLVIGSVAERVVRHASCPVFTVRVPKDTK